MSISDCQTCRDFIEDAAISIMRHLDAMDALALALQKNDSGPEIPALEDAVRICSLNRENAVARYESHVAGHDRTMAAGSGSAH
jgi:hypothetical protein